MKNQCLQPFGKDESSSSSSQSFKTSVYTTLSLKLEEISDLCLWWFKWSQFSCTGRVNCFQLSVFEDFHVKLEALEGQKPSRGYLILSCTHPRAAHRQEDRELISILAEGASMQLIGVSRAISEGRLLSWSSVQHEAQVNVNLAQAGWWPALVTLLSE